MQRADRVIWFFLIHFWRIVLNNVIHFLDLDLTTSHYRTLSIIIFNLVTQAQNFFICEEWKLSKFTDLSHFGWVYMLIT